MVDNFFDWGILSTLAGAAAATGIVAVKGIFQKFPTQLVSYVIAVVILGVATAATGMTSGAITDWTVWALVPLNAVVVAFTANGGYDAINRMQKTK